MTDTRTTVAADLHHPIPAATCGYRRCDGLAPIEHHIRAMRRRLHPHSPCTGLGLKSHRHIFGNGTGRPTMLPETSVPTMAWPLALTDQQRKQIYDAVMASGSQSVADADALAPASQLSADQALSAMHPLSPAVRHIDGIANLYGIKGKTKFCWSNRRRERWSPRLPADRAARSIISLHERHHRSLGDWHRFGK
jgi:hypothetical protein